MCGRGNQLRWKRAGTKSLMNTSAACLFEQSGHYTIQLPMVGYAIVLQQVPMQSRTLLML